MAMAVLEEFHKSGLYTATLIDDVWVVTKTKINDEQYNALKNIIIKSDHYGHKEGD